MLNRESLSSSRLPIDPQLRSRAQGLTQKIKQEVSDLEAEHMSQKAEAVASSYDHLLSINVDETDGGAQKATTSLNPFKHASVFSDKTNKTIKP